MITAEYLRTRLQYDQQTGQFTWISGGRFNRLARREAGFRDVDGYLQIRIDGVLYQAHRLAWLYMTGQWPPSGSIDHRNTQPADNRWANLRDATRSLNQENRRRANRNNKSGFLGVSANKDRWTAKIHMTENGKRTWRYLGTFDTPQEAHVVYLQAKRRLHKGCTL